MSLSSILIKNKKVKYYIRIKTYKFIILKFWIESVVNVLYAWTLVLLVFVLSIEISSSVIL